MRLRPAIVWLLGLAAAAASAQQPSLTISFDHAAGATGRFEVRGLSGEQLARLKQHAAAPSDWSGVFDVYVGSAETGQPALLGDHWLVADRLRFEPRFALSPGLTYTAVLRLAAVGLEDVAPLVGTFSIAPRPAGKPTVLTHVYPSADVLPENLLKFYLHFSAPMSRGDSYRHLRLETADGRQVELPFLELGEELWNNNLTRLTVLFDPGRIKQGLLPRQEAGPALRQGGSYTLVVDPQWRDAQGQPLAAAVRKSFRVARPDQVQPDPKRWTLVAPTAPSRQPVVVRFDEPLDRALLERVIDVRDAAGQPLVGRVEIDQAETRWRFWPAVPWSEGRYELVAATILEDLAGNSIGRPFEVDVVRPIESQVSRQTVSISFQVAGGQ